MIIITIVALVSRVRNQIRDNGTTQVFPDNLDTQGNPIPGSSPELRQFIQDAAMEYSKYRPRKRPLKLDMQPGVTNYPLPQDWMRVDNGSFRNATQPSPLPDCSDYALPFGYQSLSEKAGQFKWYDDDQTLVMESAPLQPYTLRFDYYAFHTVDDNVVTIPAQYQSSALLAAHEKALRAIATDYAVKLQKYKIGGRYGIEVDDSEIAEKLIKQAEDYSEQFRKEIILRPYGTSGGG